MEAPSTNFLQLRRLVKDSKDILSKSWADLEMVTVISRQRHRPIDRNLSTSTKTLSKICIINNRMVLELKTAMEVEWNQIIECPISTLRYEIRKSMVTYTILVGTIWMEWKVLGVGSRQVKDPGCQSYKTLVAIEVEEIRVTSCRK